MCRRVGIFIALAAIVLLGASPTSGEVRRTDNVQVAFGGTSPRSPAARNARAGHRLVSGRITSVDGTGTPSLRWLQLELNRNGRLSTTGLPTCRGATLQSTTSKAALARCRKALVGRGGFAAELGRGAPAIPTRGRILIFNSTAEGRPSLLLHLYGTTPIEIAYVLPMRIRQPAWGKFGTVLALRMPRLGGGAGAISRVDFEIGREYDYRGERRGYLSASCAAPPGFSRAVFPFARGTFRFAGGTDLETTLTRDCRVRG